MARAIKFITIILGVYLTGIFIFGIINDYALNPLQQQTTNSDHGDDDVNWKKKHKPQPYCERVEWLLMGLSEIGLTLVLSAVGFRMLKRFQLRIQHAPDESQYNREVWRKKAFSQVVVWYLVSCLVNIAYIICLLTMPMHQNINCYNMVQNTVVNELLTAVIRIMSVFVVEVVLLRIFWLRWRQYFPLSAQRQPSRTSTRLTAESFMRYPGLTAIQPINTSYRIFEDSDMASPVEINRD